MAFPLKARTWKFIIKSKKWQRPEFLSTNYYVKLLYMYIIYIYFVWNKSDLEIGIGHCPYLLLCEATLYAYYIHIYILKQVWAGNWQRSLSLSTIMWYHFICILYTYIFFETSLNRKLTTVPIYYYGQRHKILH